MKDPDYKNLVDLLAIFSEATARQNALAAQLNQEYLDKVDEHKAEYTENQDKLSQAESAIGALIDRHPEWFDKKKTLTTPYGQVKVSSGKKIIAPSEEASMRLIRAEGKADAYIRSKDELDREALEELSDEELAKYGLVRQKTLSVKITAAEVELGEAIKETEAK